MNSITHLARSRANNDSINLCKAKKIALIILCTMHSQLDANVKVFINNSLKNFFVRVYDNKNNIIGAVLAPGAVQDLFLQGDVIDKIVVQDQKHSAQPLSAMTRQVLRKETSKINDNMIFIINHDNSVKMYQGTTSRDEALRKIDEAYTKKAILPTIDLSIHTIKTDQAWTTQNINYSIKHAKGFLSSIESLFS